MRLYRVLLLILFCAITSAGFTQASGESLFNNKCANCHAKDGSGKTAFAEKAKVPDLRSGQVQFMTDQEIYDCIATGKNHKAYPHSFAMRGMSAQEINSLVKYIRQIEKK